MDQHLLPPDLEERLRRHAEECGLAELLPRLRALARPCYAAELVPDAEMDRCGTSRLGGVPDLPAGKPWPDRDGQLLTFIGQVNLAEVPRLPVPLPLPEGGLLSFFLGVDEPASNIDHEVIYWAGPGDQLTRPEEPDEAAFLNEDCTAFTTAGLRFVPAVSLPSSSRDPSLDGYSDQLEELRGKLGSPSSPRKPSQLLGHPLAISGDPPAEAYVAAHGHANIIHSLHLTPGDIDRDVAAAEAEGDAGRAAWNRRRKESLAWFHGSREHHRREIGHWQVLLEVASHRQCGMCWWDAGRLLFLIDSRDLAARDFSRTYACVQTS